MNLYEYRKRYKGQLLELIPIVRTTVKNSSSDTFKGLCKVTDYLELLGHITGEQEDIFDDYVYLFDTGKHGAYVWPIGEKQPRLEWLDEQEQILNKL